MFVVLIGSCFLFLGLWLLCLDCLLGLLLFYFYAGWLRGWDLICWFLFFLYLVLLCCIGWFSLCCVTLDVGLLDWLCWWGVGYFDIACRCLCVGFSIVLLFSLGLLVV